MDQIIHDHMILRVSNLSINSAVFNGKAIIRYFSVERDLLNNLCETGEGLTALMDARGWYLRKMNMWEIIFLKILFSVRYYEILFTITILYLLPQRHVTI